MRKFTSQEIKEFVAEPHFDEKVILDKDPSWPKISIVTPSYNQAEFLEKTILSILNQNYPNLEYIIIDGGSTDGSVELIKKYEKYLTYWINEPDNGQADAINKGFKISSGDLLAYLNSDDEFLPNALHIVAENFRRYPTVSVFYGNGYLIDENDNILREDRFTPFIKIGLIYGGTGFCQPSLFWKRDAYIKVDGIDQDFKFCMDLDLLAKFSINKLKFRYIKEHLSIYRFHPRSKTSLIIDVWKKESLLIREKYRSKFAIIPRPVFVFFIRILKFTYWCLSGDFWFAIDRLRELICPTPRTYKFPFKFLF